METLSRKPFQGVLNIIRFNWHFYLLAVVLIGLLFTVGYIWSDYQTLFYLLALLLALPIAISLLVSYYVYDVSGLYSFKWLDKINIPIEKRIGNIAAGFDETSHLLKNKLKPQSIEVFDFYNPEINTEVSIKRARKLGLIYPGTISFDIPDLPINEASVDYIFLIFSLHEIRDQQKRIEFVKNLKKKLKQGGQIIVIEHLRDLSNFLSYTVGFMHFYSKDSWLECFYKAEINVAHHDNINQFVHIFVLE